MDRLDPEWSVAEKNNIGKPDYSKVENIPVVTDVDIAFGGGHRLMPASEDLPNVDRTWHELFAKIFYGAPEGKEVIFDMKEHFNKEDGEKYWRFLKSVISSYGPKHQHKEKFCAYVFSEWLNGWELKDKTETQTIARL